MRVLPSALALLTLGAAWAATPWNRYCNARFGYCVAYPTSLEPQGEADNGDGQLFLSRDHQTELRVWGNWQLDRSDTLAARFRTTRDQPARTVTYQRLGPGWFVVSGFEGERVFYQRTLFDAGQGRFATLLLSYPRTQARATEPIVGPLAKSLTFGH